MFPFSVCPSGYASHPHPCHNFGKVSCLAGQKYMRFLCIHAIRAIVLSRTKSNFVPLLLPFVAWLNHFVVSFLFGVANFCCFALFPHHCFGAPIHLSFCLACMSRGLRLPSQIRCTCVLRTMCGIFEFIVQTKKKKIKNKKLKSWNHEP